MNLRDYYAAGSNFAKYSRMTKGISSDEKMADGWLQRIRGEWNSQYSGKGWKLAGAGPEKFYKRKYAPNYDFSSLNAVAIPSTNTIINQQKNMANTIVFLQQGKDITNILNQITNAQIQNAPFNPEKAIAEIESILTDYDNGEIGKLYNTKGVRAGTIEHHWTAQELLAHMKEHNDLLVRLNQIIQNFNTVALNGNQIAALKQLKLIKQQLEEDLALAQNLSDGEDFVLKDDRAYLQNAAWVSNILKGRYLELEGFKFLQSTLPANLEVVDLSSVQGAVLDIFTGASTGISGQMRTDLGVFDRGIASKIQMRWIMNDQEYSGSLADLFDTINTNKTATISIPDDTGELIQAINDNIIGIQAKSGYGEIQFLRKLKTGNGRQITLGDIISENNFAATALKELNMLVTEPYAARLTRTHMDYDALFNYCLSRYLTQIIGQENVIILSRAGFQTVKDWLIDQFALGKFMHASTRVHIDNLNASIGVSFGSRIS